MNRNKYAAAVLLAASLVAGTLAVGRQVEPAPPRGRQRPPQRTGGMPDHVLYGMLLHHAHVFSRAAEKAELQGRHDSAHAYRNAFKNDAELSDEQSQLLSRIAAECEQALAEQDAKAKVIIDARRAHYQRTGTVLPPSEELKVMEAERAAIVLRYRDKLRAALGEQEWARFGEFARQRVAPTITLTPAGGDPGAAPQQ